MDTKDTPTPPLSPDSTGPAGASDGWLYHNPDTGTEWSVSHPVESGEVDDAENIRPATLDAFREEMFAAWKMLEEMRQERDAAIPTPLSPDSTGPAVNEIKDAPEDEAVILFTEGEWVGEARMIRHEQTGDPIWIWASGLPVHPNHKPLGWQSMPSFAALTPSAPIKAGAVDLRSMLANLAQLAADEGRSEDAKALLCASAVVSPAAPIAAPVRDDGAREALRTAFMEGFAAGHEDAEEAGRPLPGGRGVRGPQDPEVFWLRSDVLAPLSAPIAAPVRDDGARERVRNTLVSFVQHTDVTTGFSGRGIDAIDWSRRDELVEAILASLPAPAGDVPGEAQTHVTPESNVQALGDHAGPADPVLVEHLRRLLTMAETGVLRWFYAVGQTSNNCQVVHAGGEPVDPKAAFYAVDRAHDCLAIKAGIGHAEKNT